jgi:transcriptional regulator with XRE-family HTH domain
MPIAVDPAESAERRAAFGANVRRARLAKSWRLQDVSDATGLALPKLSRIENGKERYLRVDEVEALARALGRPASWLMSKPRGNRARVAT